MIEGIIFDMDGVLFDTEPFYFQRRQEFLASKGLEVEHLQASDFIGGHLKDIWSSVIGNQLTSREISAISEEYEDLKKEQSAPYSQLIYPEVRNCLSTLKKKQIKLALASNSSREDIERALELSEIAAYFDIVISSEDVKHPKPAPDIYVKAQKDLGLDKSHLLVIEDSYRGILAAKEAALEVWAIRDQRSGIDQGNADKLIENLNALIDM